MDAKVRELFNKVKASAADVSRNAGKVASGLVNQAKLNIRIAELNGAIENDYKNLGKMLYAVHNGVEIPADAIDETLAEIDGKMEEINALRDTLQAAKADVVCPVCGKYVGKKAAFCSACGAKIEREASCTCEEEVIEVIPAADGCCDGESFEEPECCCEESCCCEEAEEACCEETAEECCCCEEAAEETCCCEEEKQAE